MFIQNTLISPVLLPLESILKIFQICSFPISRYEEKIAFGADCLFLEKESTNIGGQNVHHPTRIFTACGVPVTGTWAQFNNTSHPSSSQPPASFLSFAFPIPFLYPFSGLSYLPSLCFGVLPHTRTCNHKKTELILKVFGFLSLAYLSDVICHLFVIISHPTILYHYHICWKISAKYLSNFGVGTFNSLSSCSTPFPLVIGLKTPFLFIPVSFARSHSAWVLTFLILVSSTVPYAESLFSPFFIGSWLIAIILCWGGLPLTFRVIFTGFVLPCFGTCAEDSFYTFSWKESWAFPTFTPFSSLVQLSSLIVSPLNFSNFAHLKCRTLITDLFLFTLSFNLNWINLWSLSQRLFSLIISSVMCSLFTKTNPKIASVVQHSLVN